MFSGNLKAPVWIQCSLFSVKALELVTYWVTFDLSFGSACPGCVFSTLCACNVGERQGRTELSRKVCCAVVPTWEMHIYDSSRRQHSVLSTPEPFCAWDWAWFCCHFPMGFNKSVSVVKQALIYPVQCPGFCPQHHRNNRTTAIFYIGKNEAPLSLILTGGTSVELVSKSWRGWGDNIVTHVSKGLCTLLQNTCRSGFVVSLQQYGKGISLAIHQHINGYWKHDTYMQWNFM